MTELTSNLSEWPEEGHIFPLKKIDLRVLDGTHPFYSHAVEAIKRNWESEVAANPALFDGRMVLQRRLRLEDGVLRGEAYFVPYSALLLWRKTRPKQHALHLFGMPVILSSDGAVIAIRMAQHTANPGQVYCAGGSLDPDDVTDGRCDVVGNMVREVREETGLDLTNAEMDAGFHASHHNGAVTLYRRFRFALPAVEIVEKIARHVAKETKSEIECAVILRSTDPTLHRYPPFMPSLLRWVL